MNWSYSFCAVASAAFVLDIGGLLCLVHLGVGHELVILFLCSGFCSFCVCLQSRKITLDHFEHANDATIFGLHTLVFCLENLRGHRLLLQQSSRLCCFCVEIL